jgi:hypothetical protein
MHAVHSNDLISLSDTLHTCRGHENEPRREIRMGRVGGSLPEPRRYTRRRQGPVEEGRRERCRRMTVNVNYLGALIEEMTHEYPRPI